MTLLALAYFALGRLGLAYSFLRPSVTPVWPPSGLALAGLLILGYRVWPATFLGALAVGLSTPIGIFGSVVLAASNTLETLLGAWLANRFANGRNFFRHPWDVVKFTSLVGVLSPLVSPPLGVRAVTFDRFIPWASDPSVGLIWWLGDLVSLLVLTPLLLVWTAKPWPRLRWRQILEFGALVFLLVGVGRLVFGDAASPAAGGYLYLYLCLPLLAWAAFRFSEREMMSATFLLGLVVMKETTHRDGLFAQISHDKALLVYQAFMATASVMSMCLAAVVGQRRRATEELRQAQRELELRVTQRTQALRAEVAQRTRAEQELRVSKQGLEAHVAAQTAELRQMNQILRMVSECNQALVRISDERHLMEEICRVIVQIGGYRMAWVGFAQSDEMKSVWPAAAVGVENGYLEKIKVSWGDNRFGQGPTGTSIRTGAVCLGRNFLTEPRLAPWRELALARGFRSSIALPLLAQGEAFGALTIYATEPDSFSQSQIELLKGLAEDLAFGITAVRTHAEKARVGQELEQKAGQLQALTGELVQAEARERRHLAQILHDSLQQLLVGARYNLELLRKQLSAPPAQETISRIDGFLAECLQTSRSLTAELSPPVLYEAGLASALRWLGRWFQETHGLAVEVLADCELLEQPEAMRVTVFQAIRELLFNVVKHAHASGAQVRVDTSKAGLLVITVSDQGAGFDPTPWHARRSQGQGTGLFSLRERLDLLGGVLGVDSAPGAGSRFTIKLPLNLGPDQVGTSARA